MSSLRITINPIFVKLSISRDELDRLVASANPEDGKELAKFMLVHSHKDTMIQMKDNRTGIIYESSPLDEDDIPDINYLFESMLNKINLTHIQKLDNA